MCGIAGIWQRQGGGVKEESWRAMGEIRDHIAKKQRVLVITLTKRMAEELSLYLIETGTKAAYFHSDVDNMERLEILRDLRVGKYGIGSGR